MENKEKTADNRRLQDIAKQRIDSIDEGGAFETLTLASLAQECGGGVYSWAHETLPLHHTRLLLWGVHALAPRVQVMGSSSPA